MGRKNTRMTEGQIRIQEGCRRFLTSCWEHISPGR